MGRLAILLVLLAAAGGAAVVAGRGTLASALVFAGFVLAGYAVYRARARRSVETARFFSDVDDETRHAGLQGDPGAGPDRPR
jgi:hypothetical protein